MGISEFISKAVREAVESAGPKVAGVTMTLDEVRVSPLTGKGSIERLVVGNPEGFSMPSSFTAGQIDVEVKASTLLAEKVVIRSIRIHRPEIVLEGNLEGSNLWTIHRNIRENQGRRKEAGRGLRDKRFQVDEFVILQPKAHLSLTVMQGRALARDLPDIRLADLGQGDGGITGGELAQAALQAILDALRQAASDRFAGISRDVGRGLGRGVAGASKVIKGFFRR